MKSIDLVHSKRMMLLLPILTLVLTACPYKSDYPVDVPNQKVDITMLGKWEDANGSTSMSGEKAIYSVTKKSEFIYGIETSSWYYDEEAGESFENKQIFDGHISLIGDTKFFNVKQTFPEQDADGKYYIYMMEVAGNNCILSEVSACIDKTFSSSSELKSFLLKNINNELLYSGSATFFRN